MDLKEYFSKVFGAGSYAHFYLLSDAEAIDCALSVLFCDTHSACGECAACRRWRNGFEGDFFALRAENGSKIKDEQVAEAIEHTKTKPIGKFGVVAVYEADKLTERAQNHLLKSLEEAPRGVVYFMETQHPQRLLPTVLSRAIKIRGRSSRTGGSTLTEALLSLDSDKRELAFSKYRGAKDQKQNLINELVLAADDIAAELRRAVLSGESDRAKMLEDLVLRLDRAASNIERNGHFELNLDLLVNRRPFGEGSWS